MIKHETSSLGTKLAPILGSGFFHPLTRPTAPIYIDCAERLVEAADEGGQVAHAGACLLIREVLTDHPDVQLDDDEGGQLRDLNQLAAQFFNKLIEAHWLEPRRLSLDEHFVLITPQLRRLLRLLRETLQKTVRPIYHDARMERTVETVAVSANDIWQRLKLYFEQVDLPTASQLRDMLGKPSMT